MLTVLEALGRYTAFLMRAFMATALAVPRPRESVRQFYAVFTGALTTGF